jgi:DNA-binding beta-propeller fold protein YncE
MDERTGEMMDIKAVLLEALPPGTAAKVSSIEDLMDRLAQKRRRRHSTMGTVGALVVMVPLLIVLLLPFGRTDHPSAVHVGAGPTRNFSTIGLTRFSLPGSFFGYVPTDGSIAITPDGRTAYIAGAQDGLVTPVDLSSGRVLPPIQLGRFGSYLNAIAISPDGRTGYVVEGGIEDTIVPIDLATRTVGPAIRVPGPRALGSSIAISPDGHMAYVDSLGEDDTLSTSTVVMTRSVPSYIVPINLKTNRAQRPVSLDQLGGGGDIVRSEEPTCITNCAFDETIGGIAIAPDGLTAFVSDTESTTNGVFPIDLTNGRIGAEIVVGGATAAPGPLVITPDGRNAYVGGDGTVTRIDLSSDTPSPWMSVAPAENFGALAITPDGHTLVASGYPDVDVVNLGSGVVQRRIGNRPGGGDIAIPSA